MRVRNPDRLLDFMDMLEVVRGSKSDPAVAKKVAAVRLGFDDAMDNDLNISEALAAVFDFVRDINTLSEQGKLGRKGAALVKKAMLDFDSVLGVLEREKRDIGKDVELLIGQREEARKRKDYAKSDEIRKRLEKMGVILEDTPDGVRWKMRGVKQ